VSDEEKLLLDSLPPLEISEQVRQIMRLMPQPKPKPDFGKLVSDWLQQFLPEPGLLRPVSAFALILLLAVVGKWWAWPTYRYFTLVQQSQSQMAEQFKIYYKGELRPAGSYHSSPIAQEMSGTSVDQPERLQTQKIDTLLRDALSYKPAGEAAQRMLTQYYLLQNRDAQADSMLKLLESSSLHVAAVLNDRGILFFHRGQYDSAAIAFERAFALNPGLDEALYNLAITQTRRGDLVAAKKSWEACLKLEVPAEWRNAAQAQLQELEEQQMQ
jgi:tetratricopeptide (TPR) repeat protein